MTKITTWNVNSVKARLGHLIDWLKSEKPGIALLQELKCQDDAFPRMEIEDAGYNVALSGQKSYNGVAILSRTPLEDVMAGLPGNESDPQTRYIEAVTSIDGKVLRVASIYLPNGNPVDSEKYGYKLDWMAHLKRHAESLLSNEEPVVLGGDYNVIPEPGDVYDPDAWREDALFRPETRRAFREILNLGYTDAYRALHQELGRYTFWDYQAGAWQKDFGLRIDHLLLSPQAADLLTACEIDKTPRGKPRPSDHTPIWCELNL